MKKLWIVVLAVLIACAGQKKQEQKAETEEMPKPAMEEKAEYAKTEAGNPIVQFKTTMGDFEMEVFEKDCPIHGSNFLKLVKADYYNDNIFHRVIPDFMIQTGDPTGTGHGTPGYMLPQEEKPFKYKNLRSYIAMAQTPDGQVNGSQFYILVKDSQYLDDKFPCFARVIQGMDVVDAISKVKTDKNDKPIEDVRIISASLKPVQAPVDSTMESQPAESTGT